MYSVFRRACERLLRIPHDPAPPPGDDAGTRVFRAAPLFFKFLLVRWGIGTAFTLLLVLLLFGSINFGVWVAVQDSGKPQLPALIVSVITGFIFLLLVLQRLFSLAVLRLDYEKRWYVVTDRSLRVREGVTTVREMTVTFANIQNVAVLQGPIQRVLGLADLQVETAGGGAAHADQKQLGPNLHVAWFRGINNAEEVKTLIQDRLRKLKDAGLGDREDQALPATAAPALLEALRAVHAESRALRMAAGSSTHFTQELSAIPSSEAPPR
ncbi:MAG: hypothetical protein QOE70_1138 [Chthoniobacter sp.]|jgi:uncharacterized membrane protein YdbT with pleckstrin-like domain|nr:hypothetical protein [Chthoniobacter sp.]